MSFLLVLSLLFVQNGVAQVCQTDSAEVEYYERLIKKNVLQSLSYRSPTNADEFRPKSDEVSDFGQFDFIVVGAGAAGAVIANRLTEIKKWKVLLLEAGGDLDEFGMIPGMTSYLLKSKYNWNFTTTEQTGCCLSTGKRCSVNRGKAMGGSTSINGLNYARGSEATFNRWERDGNKGWSYRDVLPYFIKSENCQVDGDPDYHGKGGYWNIRNTLLINPQTAAILEANKNLFNYTSTDYNGKCQIGFFIKQQNEIRGQRQSTARAFLTPFENRTNLVILRHAYATKILIENKSARGVEFSYNGTLFHAHTTKEVIVSAGGILSPRLLLLSGIGIKEDLEKLNISPIKNLPVGYNIVEPPSFSGLSEVTNYTATLETLQSMIKEYIKRQGELTIANFEHAIGFYQSTFDDVSGEPDIRISMTQSNSLSDRLQQITKQNTSKINQRTSCGISVELLAPLSISTVKLKTNDPYDYPLIDPNYYSNPQDLEVMYRGVQIAKRLVESPEMKRLNAILAYQNYPECEMYDETSKDYWFCFFRYAISVTIFQGMGSCRMGCNSNTSVVNNKLKVHGIANLRVADGSIIPSSISGAVATVVMIGEKVSDIIKRQYNERVERIDNVFGYNN